MVWKRCYPLLNLLCLWGEHPRPRAFCPTLPKLSMLLLQFCSDLVFITSMSTVFLILGRHSSYSEWFKRMFGIRGTRIGERQQRSNICRRYFCSGFKQASSNPESCIVCVFDPAMLPGTLAYPHHSSLEACSNLAVTRHSRGMKRRDKADSNQCDA